MDATLLSFISKQAAVLVPALYVIGVICKKSNLPDRFIPLTLMILGIVFGLFTVGLDVQGAIQGILVAGAAIGINQVFKQTAKIEE